MNTPYNDDSSIFPTIAMSGILAVGGTASYYAYSNPAKLSKVFNDAVNWVAPKTHEGFSSLQSSILASNKVFHSASKLGATRREATYLDREKRSADKLDKISKRADIRPLAIDPARLSETVNRITKPNHLLNMGNLNFDDIVDGHGNAYGETILKNFNNETGFNIGRKDVTMNGTSMEFEIDGKKVSLPTSKFDKETKAWIHKKDGKLSVLPWSHDYTLQKDGTIGMNLVSPNVALGETFTDVSGQGVKDWRVRTQNSFDTRDQIKSSRSSQRDVIGKEIDKLKGMLEGEGQKTLGNPNMIKRLVNEFMSDAQGFVPTDLAYAQQLGQKSVARASSAYGVELEGRLDGFASDHMSLGDSMSSFGESQQHSAEAIRKRFNMVGDVRRGKAPLTLERQSFGGFGGSEDVFRSNVGLTYAQAQTAKGTIFLGGTQSVVPFADANKSLTKGYTFTKPVNGIPYSVNPNMKAQAERMYGAETRSRPVTWSAEVEAANPHLYGRLKNNSMLNVPSILGPNGMEEVVLTDGRLLSHMSVERPVSFNVTRAAFAHEGTKLPTESYVTYKTREAMKNGTGTRLVRHRDKTLGMLFEDQELLSRVEVITGKHVGYIDPTGLIDSIGSAYKAVNGKNQSVNRALPFTMRREHIDATNQQYMNSIGQEGSGTTFYASQVEHGTKAGLSGQTRFALERIPGTSTTMARPLNDMAANEGTLNRSLIDHISKRLLVRPEQIESPKLYEKVITMLKGKEITAGKNVPELPDFLQRMIYGHLNTGQDTELSGTIKDTFANLLADPSKFDGSLISSMEKGHLQFDPKKLSAEGVNSLITVAGAQQENYGGGNFKLDDTYGYERGKKALADSLNSNDLEKVRTRPINLMSGNVIHEGQLAQGIGTNTFVLGVNDSLHMVPQEWMKELAIKNLAPTEQINQDVSLMLSGFKREIGPDLQKVGVGTLDKDGLEKMLDGVSNASDIDDPLILSKSFLSKDINPKGFALLNHEGQSIAFGSHAVYQGGQYLPEEGRAAVLKNARFEAGVLVRARENNGIISKEDTEKLYRYRTENYRATATGPIRAGAIHVEGSLHGINTSEANWLNNADIIKGLVKNTGVETENLFGSIVGVDKASFKQSIYRELDTARIMAEDSRSKGLDGTAKGWLREAYGEDSLILKHIGSGKFESAEDAIRIAQEITDISITNGERVKKLAYELSSTSSPEKMAELNNLIEKHSTPYMVHRFPSESNTSTSYGFGFAMDIKDVGSGKTLAVGHKIGSNINADWDGDKFFAVQGNMIEQRAANLKKVMGSQRITANYMALLKKSPLLDKAMNTESVKTFHFPEASELPQLIDAINGAESESAIAAMFTKEMTGSANYRAHEIQNSLMEKVLTNKNLKGEALDHATAFAYSLPGQTIVQRVISSKDTESILRPGQESSLQKMDSIMSSIGKVTPEQFLQGVSNVKGDLGPLQMYAIMHGAKAKEAAWLSPNGEAGKTILPQLKTLFDIKTSYKRVTDEAEFTLLHKTLKTAEKDIPIMWGNYNRAADELEEIGGGFLKNRPGHIEAFGDYDHVFDMITAHAKSGAGSVSTSLDAEIKRAEQEFRRLRANGNKEGAAAIFTRLDSMKVDLAKELSSATLMNEKLLGERILGKESRTLRYMDAAKKAIGPMRPSKVVGIVGAGLVALTALNILGGDGSPEDPNDLPSVNNPSFSHQRAGQMAERRVLNSPTSSNMSMGLITGSNDRMDDSMQSASAMFLGGRHNTVAVRSDGSNPYSSDMFKYSN